MTVRELREKLAEFDQDSLVVMSSDGEGNGFSPLSGLGDSIYVDDDPESIWDGAIYLNELTDELRKQGYTEEDLYDGDYGQLAVVLWPTN
jgi:hypothetical protein